MTIIVIIKLDFIILIFYNHLELLQAKSINL
jgi:hypothetical protein